MFAVPFVRSKYHTCIMDLFFKHQIIYLFVGALDFVKPFNTVKISPAGIIVGKPSFDLALKVRSAIAWMVPDSFKWAMKGE